MNAFQALRRIQAWKEGRPLPRGETLHFPLAEAEETLVLAFVKMGGETAPWGIAWGRPDRRPEIAVVPEPRNRDAAAEMAAGFAPALLAHLFHPEHGDLQVYGPDIDRPLRQLWLPNASHAEMLHHLQYAYAFARRGDPERVALLNALGRAAGWLFRELNRPGQMLVMAATEALKESFVFPCEDVRQGHLGFLLAWLEEAGDRESRLAAAAEAEKASVSTALTPSVEKLELEDRVEKRRAAVRDGRESEALRIEREIAGVLTAELTRRFEATARAIEVLRRDGRRTNRHVDELPKDGWAAHWRGYLETERRIADASGAPVFVPSPETDRDPSWAARNYFVQQGCEDRRRSLLLDDDAEMQAEAIAAGEAVEGTIRHVRDEGPGRATLPVWDVETDDEAPTKLRKDKEVFVAGLRNRKGRIRDIRLEGGRTVFTIAIEGLKTVPRRGPAGGVLPATDARLVGEAVILLPAVADGIHERKRKKLGATGAPGSWLTDSRPAKRLPRLPAEVAGPLDAPDGDGDAS